MKRNLVDLFNRHYVSVVEIISGIKPKTISSTCNINGTDEIQHIINQYKDQLTM